MSANGDLPSGRVTFVMTDIEGSTALLRRLGEDYARLVFRHRELVSEAVRAQGGVVFGTEGDACFCAFPEAADALGACIQAQRALRSEPWPQDADVRVRMGVHSGQAEPFGDNYIALALHQAARVAAAGHGGQVLLTAETCGACEDELPADAALLDLGSFRLKDFPDAERLYQLQHPELRADFPPPRSLSARSHNLPRAGTSFIGRMQERTRLGQLLSTHSVVTLAGSGGVGKTRLALEVAGDVLPHLADGVWLVELATANDLESAARACAFSLGVAEQPGRSLIDTLGEAVEDKSLLVILDNCEHLLETAGQLALRLVRGGRARVLATSREPLRLSAEQVVRVTPLPTGDSGGELSEAARLFVERVQTLRTDFVLDPKSIAAVNEICRRLDGVPLALELAASRVRALPLSEVAGRLKDRFRLLAGGSRDGASRHQTLRATVEWSYELLTAQERLMFERLAVFADGWDLDAAEQVCSGDGIEAEDTLDLLTALVDKSLVTYSASLGEHRYGMLETLRDFAHEKLRASGAFPTQRRLLAWALELSETAAPRYTGGEGSLWMARMLSEQDNLRAAMEIGHRLGMQIETVRLTTALTHFWIKRGRLREGAQWTERATALPVRDSGVRAQLLIGLGRLLRGSDNRRAEKVLWQALELGRAAADTQLQLEALKQLTTSVRDRGDYDAAGQYLNEQLRLLRNFSDDYRRFIVETELATLDLQQGCYAEAAVKLRQKVVQARLNHWHYDGARLANSLAIALIELGEHDEAWKLAAEGAATFRELGSLEGLGHLLSTAGMALLRQQDYVEARRHFTESGRIALELGASNLAPEALERLAAVEAATGRPLYAARYAAAADALYTAVGYEREPSDQVFRAQLQATLQQALAPGVLADAQAQAAVQARTVLAEALGAVHITAPAAAGTATPAQSATVLAASGAERGINHLSS